MSRVSIFKYTILVRSCVYSNNNDFEKSVQFLNSKREKNRSKKHKRREIQKKREVFEILPLRLRVVFDAFPVPFRLLFPTKGSSSHIKSISKSSSRLSSFFCIAFATLFLLVPARGKVVFFFFFVVASFFSPAKHLGDEDASTTILAVILDGLESGISGVIAFLFVLSSCSFSLVLFVLVRSFNLLLLLFFVVVAVVRRIFREDILKMFLKNDFQTNCSRIKESPSECTRGHEEEKRVSYILLLVVEVYRVFAKRRRTGVVRLFCVLVSLVFVGGGCVDMKVRKLSLAFFAALFEKKILHVKI